LATSWQLVASLVVFYIPLVQQLANLHVVIDLSGWQPPKFANWLRTSWQLETIWKPFHHCEMVKMVKLVSN